jgi:hypothetical protein
MGRLSHQTHVCKCGYPSPPRAVAKRSHTADKRGFSEFSTPSLKSIPSTARKMVKKNRMDSARLPARGQGL